MRWTLITAAIFVAALRLAAADVSGTWKGSMDTTMGAVEVILTLQPGPGVSGTVKVGEDEAKIENGKLEGDRISFEMNIEHGKVTYEGTVAGDEMRLDVTGTQGDKYRLVCKRQG